VRVSGVVGARVTLQDGRIGGDGAAVCNGNFLSLYQNLIFNGADWENGPITDSNPTIRDN
jgi:Right handed beta helix region